jgi:hypothetical protein
MLVGSFLHSVEVGLFSGMGCMVSQPYATGGNQLYPGVLDRNRWPVAPRVNYPDRGVWQTTFKAELNFMK